MSIKYEPASEPLHISVQWCVPHVSSKYLTLKPVIRDPEPGIRIFSSSLLLSSLELSDTKVYEPHIRALLGTASHFCEVVVLKSKTLNAQAVRPMLRGWGFGGQGGWPKLKPRTPFSDSASRIRKLENRNVFGAGGDTGVPRSQETRNPLGSA